MNVSQQTAKHFREVFFGGNWTTSNLKDLLDDVTWTEALHQIDSLNNIVTLTYHMSYYVFAIRKVLEGKPLEAKDAYSFDHPEINKPEDWNKMRNEIWDEVEKCADLIEQLPEEKMWQDFADPKYGIYFRNLIGLIEHTHYHLGQIAIIKKMIRS